MSNMQQVIHNTRIFQGKKTKFEDLQISTLRLMTTKMSDFNVASVKHIFCKSGFTKHITTKHIDFMYGCLYWEKSFSRREYYKIHVEKCSNKTTESLIVINVKEQWSKIKIKIVRRPNNMGHHPIY